MFVEHLDRAVDEADPAIATGVVRDLLIGEPGAERGEQVERFGVADAQRREVRPELGQVVLGDLERLGRRLEPRERALEQQLVSREVSSAELDEVVDDRLERR